MKLSSIVLIGSVSMLAMTPVVPVDTASAYKVVIKERGFRHYHPRPIIRQKLVIVPGAWVAQREAWIQSHPNWRKHKLKLKRQWHRMHPSIRLVY
jgi:hypothetical protein